MYQFSLPSNSALQFGYQFGVALSPESRMSSSCSSCLHTLYRGIDWSRQFSFSWWPRTAIVTRTPLISCFCFWIEFKCREMKESVSQICYYSWYFLVYHMLVLILFHSLNYCFCALIWQPDIRCYFLTMKTPPLPLSYSYFLRKKHQTYSIMVSMYEFNFSFHRPSCAENNEQLNNASLLTK